MADIGPLMVSPTNPRYFAVKSNKASGSTAGSQAVYLTGSHIWNNFHDGMGPGADCAAVSEPLDYDAYLDFLGATVTTSSGSGAGSSSSPRPPEAVSISV